MINKNDLVEQQIDTIPTKETWLFYDNSVISPGWQKVRFDDICSLRTGVANPEENLNSRYVGLEHMDSGVPRLKHWGWASEVMSSKTYFYTGDILYGKLRPYLDKAVLADFDGICSTDILVFTAKTGVESSYLSYLVHTRSFLDYAIQSTKGVNHPRTSWSSLALFEASLPPLSEQRTIAHILQTVQNAIQTRRKEIELERERKAALMQHLFTYGTRSEPTKMSAIGEIPESWEAVRLGKLFTTQLGKMLSPKAKIGKSSKPYMRNANVQWGRVDCSEVFEMDFDENEKAKFRLKYDDILVCEGGEVGRTAIWRDELPECYFQKAIHRLRPSNGQMLPAFFLYHMERAFRYANIYGVAGTETTIAHLPQDKLLAMKIPKPSLDEQKEIANILQACDSKIAALEKELALHEELFRALLDELMSGRLSALPVMGHGRGDEGK